MTKIKEITLEEIKEAYIDYVLEHELKPKSVYKFCKTNKIEETAFYKQFNSMKALEISIWNTFVENTHATLTTDENYATYDGKAQILSFYFTLFENFQLYRSYILFVTEYDKMGLITTLNHLRSVIKPSLKKYAEHYSSVLNHVSEELGSRFSEEALWLQFAGIFKFWISDTSKGFESTDAFIEKSVQISFDLSQNLPIESIIDYGKFIFHELRSR